MSENNDSVFDFPPEAIQARRELDDAKRFIQSGKIEEGQNVAREILGSFPEYVEALTTLGHGYLAENNHSAALPCFVRASMLAENDPAILVDLARVYLLLGSDEMARQTAEHALTLTPGEDVVCALHLLLGQICRQQRDYDAAIAHLEKAASSADPAQEASSLLGACHIAAGHREQAVTVLLAASKEGMSALDHAEAIYRLSGVSDVALAKKLLGELDTLDKETPSFGSEEDEGRFSAFRAFARGVLLDRAGEHEDAWQALESANGKMGGGFKEVQQQLRDMDEQIIQRASDWMFAGAPLDGVSEQGPLSLFILGAPCSGKSTLERLIGAANGVARGYDHELVQLAARETATSNDFLPLNYPGQLPTSMHRQFADVFARETKRRANGADVLTCTNAGLLADLGRIAETVQKMKVVFIKRDSDDTAFRIYEQYFSDGSNPYAYDVTAIYEQLEIFGRLCDAWAEALHGVCLRVSYEDLVGDPKAVLKRVADFCGIDASKAKIPALGDDRGCAEPYRENLERARSGAIAPLSGWAVPEL